MSLLLLKSKKNDPVQRTPPKEDTNRRIALLSQFSSLYILKERFLVFHKIAFTNINHQLFAFLRNEMS